MTLESFTNWWICKMEGEDEEFSNDPRGFNKVPALSRIAVVVAEQL